MKFRLSLLFSSAKKTIDGSGRRVKGKQQQLNSSLMLSLGAVALKVLGGGGGGGQMQEAERSYPWQPWKREPPKSGH